LSRYSTSHRDPNPRRQKLLGQNISEDVKPSTLVISSGSEANLVGPQPQDVQVTLKNGAWPSPKEKKDSSLWKRHRTDELTFHSLKRCPFEFPLHINAPLDSQSPASCGRAVVVQGRQAGAENFSAALGTSHRLPGVSYLPPCTLASHFLFFPLR
jgi:hypothetical protein